MAVLGLTLRVARWREGAPGTPLLFLCSPERAVAYQQAVAALRAQPLALLAGRRRQGAFRAFEVPLDWLAEGLAAIEREVPRP